MVCTILLLEILLLLNLLHVLIFYPFYSHLMISQNIYFEHIKGYANIITANIHLIDQIIVHNMCFIIRYFEVLL